MEQPGQEDVAAPLPLDEAFERWWRRARAEALRHEREARRGADGSHPDSGEDTTG